jgi:hypothetical protein
MFLRKSFIDKVSVLMLVLTLILSGAKIAVAILAPLT